MKRKQIKFIVGSMAIILTLIYLGFSGFNESFAYYQTVSELYASKEQAYERRLRVSGDVVPGSIFREGKVVRFTIHDPENKNDLLNIRYVGTDPLPDTFRDYATAVVAGEYGRDGVFTGNSMTAKCASKYEKETAAGVTAPETMK
jgi:cytochrome c-type biogenesis protein CcmE